MTIWTICFRSPQNSNETRSKMASNTKVDSQLLEPCIFTSSCLRKLSSCPVCIFTSSCLGKWTFEPSTKLPIHPLIMRGNWNYRVPIPIDPWMDSNEANTRPKLLLVWISTNNAIATCVQVTVSGWMHKIDTSWVMQQWAVDGRIQTEQGGLSVDGSKKITVDKPCFWFGLFPCWQTLFFVIQLRCPKENHFIDFSRFICNFLTVCFSRRMDRAKIPFISRNLWQEIAKPQIVWVRGSCPTISRFETKNWYSHFGVFVWSCCPKCQPSHPCSTACSPHLPLYARILDCILGCWRDCQKISPNNKLKVKGFDLCTKPNVCISIYYAFMALWFLHLSSGSTLWRCWQLSFCGEEVHPIGDAQP